METTKINGYKKECDICHLVIEGVSKKQVEYNFQLHHASCVAKLKKVKNNENRTTQI